MTRKDILGRYLVVTRELVKAAGKRDVDAVEEMLRQRGCLIDEMTKLKPLPVTDDETKMLLDVECLETEAEKLMNEMMDDMRQNKDAALKYGAFAKR